MASRAPSPFRYEKDQSNAHIHGPIVHSSESEVVSAATGPVASVTWPALKYPCSLAGSYQEPRLLKHLDGNCTTTAEMQSTVSGNTMVTNSKRLYQEFAGHSSFEHVSRASIFIS